MQEMYLLLGCSPGGGGDHASLGGIGFESTLVASNFSTGSHQRKKEILAVSFCVSSRKHEGAMFKVRRLDVM